MNNFVISVPIATAILLMLFLWNVWRLFRPAPSPIDRPAIFFPLIFLLLFVIRLPHIGYEAELFADESQLLAQAMRFVNHPVPWRDVDGTTSGPLNSMFLTVPLYLGMPPLFQLARIMLWASLCAILVLLYSILRRFGSVSETQFVLMPTIFFFAFPFDRDFIHHSSETLPNLLLSASACLLSMEWASLKPSRFRLFVLGIFLGAIPFTKLQATPIALFLTILTFIKMTRCSSLEDNRIRQMTSFCMGGLFVPLLILGIVMASGAFDDFWKSYILATSNYANPSLRSMLVSLVLILRNRTDFTPLALDFLGILILLLFARVFRRTPMSRNLYWLLIFALCGVFIALICVVTASKPFYHYLNFLVPPLTIFLGSVFFAGRAMFRIGAEPSPVTSPMVRKWTFIFCFWLILVHLYNVNTYYNVFRKYYVNLKPPNQSMVARHALALSDDGDEMSIWGWAPGYYVETGIPPATRDAITQFSITPGPYREYFRDRHLSDLKHSRPAIFIDAIADGEFLWNWTFSEKHESFPELAKFVQQNYKLYLNIHKKRGANPIRIYVSKKRLAELNSSVEPHL